MLNNLDPFVSIARGVSIKATSKPQAPMETKGTGRPVGRPPAPTVYVVPPALDEQLKNHKVKPPKPKQGSAHAWCKPVGADNYGPVYVCKKEAH